MRPRFSLVMTTIRGRERHLEACLASIDRQRFRDFEVIVIDQASSPEVRALVERYPWARYEPAPMDGLSASRNRGLACTHGELVAFPDDDAALSPETLERADAIFRADPELGLLSGCALDPQTRRRIFRFPSRPAVLSIWNVLSRHFSNTIIVRRRALDAQPVAFDPMLGPGTKTGFCAFEETDLVFRLLLTGVRGRYEPSVLVYHPDTRLVNEPRQKAMSYSMGAGACFRKCREQFGWWPIGALWIWTLVRACGAVVIDALRGEPAHVRQRLASIRARLRGWRLYGDWLARSRAAPNVAADTAS
jgi:glycosyltransferase involved in cell wall biosynthesis